MSGELSHHVILDAVSHDRSVMVCNHSNTERGFLKELRARLESELGEEFTFVVSQTDRDPLSVFCFVCSTQLRRGFVVYWDDYLSGFSFSLIHHTTPHSSNQFDFQFIILTLLLIHPSIPSSI